MILVGMLQVYGKMPLAREAITDIMFLSRTPFYEAKATSSGRSRQFKWR
jgi:hypothetical protein